MVSIKSYKELRVYQAAMDAAMQIFEVSKGFPPEEKYCLVDQIRRSSRSVCANIGEAWRKRRYQAHFVSKLSDAETEAKVRARSPRLQILKSKLKRAQIRNPQ